MQRSNTGQTTDARKAELEKIRSITGSFDELVRRDLAADPKLRIALHREALDAIRSGDVATGRSILYKYFGETVPLDEHASDDAMTLAK